MEWPPEYSHDFTPSRDQEYWSPELETMEPVDRDKHVLKKLQNQVKYVYQNSGFYQEFYKDTTVNPANISSLEEFSQLPILTKEDIRREQELHPPYGRFLCVDPKDIFRVHGTSGTTGRPTVFGIGKADWKRIAEAHARILWGAGLRPDDTVMVASVFSLYVGSWGALVGAERLGASCFPFGSGAPGQTERAVEWASMVKPSALYGTPSYALYLAETARQMGFDPKRDFGFRFMFFSGEPGASVPATRRLIEDTFGCYIVDQGTMAEMTPWMSASGCRHLDGGMHLWQDIVYTEMIDPQSELSVSLGGEGVPVYSHTERTSQPMIRYWSGDISRWDMVNCPCGRTYPTLVTGIYGRVDDMIIVRGQNVFPSRIEDVLRGLKEFGGEFRLVLEREPGQMDNLTVQAEVRADAYTSQEFDALTLETIREIFTTELRRAIGVSVVVQLKPEGEFERTQFKARRIIDLRNR